MAGDDQFDDDFGPIQMPPAIKRLRYSQVQLDAAVMAAVEGEREACAKLADSIVLTSLITGKERNSVERAYADGFNTGAADASDHITDAIRARGTDSTGGKDNK